MHASVEIVDFDTETSADRLRTDPAHADRWLAKLPDLDGYDIVVSDNLPEILERRPDAVLVGHFLWHLALENVAPEYASRCQALLGAHRPKMIVTYLVADDRLKEWVEIHAVGLFGSAQNSSQPKTNALISCGLGVTDFERERDFIARIATQAVPPFDMVYVEPRLLPATAPDWLMAAKFDDQMYRSLKAVVCRPGVGTLTDGLLSGARIFCFYESGNLEMVNNAQKLVAYGMGEDCITLETAWRRAREFAVSAQEYEDHENAIGRLETGGHEAAAELLISWV